MKFRTGFVSNSSSSSYIVALPMKCVTFDEFLETGLATYEWDPETRKDFQPNLDLPVSNCEVYSDVTKTNRECLRQLWDDISTCGVKASIEDMIELIDGFDPETICSCAWEYPFVDTYCVPHNISNTYDELYGRDNARQIEKNLIKIGKEWNHLIGEAMIRDLSKFCNMYIIIYSDNDGQGLMEHGKFWEYVYHIRISQH